MPLSIAKDLAPGERVLTNLYRQTICEIATRGSYRNAAIVFNVLTKRKDTEDELSVRTMAHDVMNEGKLLIDCKEAWAAQTLEKYGFDPITGFYPGDALPANLQNQRPREVTFCPWNIAGYTEAQWNNLCQSREVKSIASENGKTFSAPCTSTYKTLKKRRTSRVKVEPDKITSLCTDYIRQVNYLDGDSRHWIRHKWTLEIDPEEILYIAADAVLVPEQSKTRISGGKEHMKESSTRVSHWNIRVEASVQGAEMVYNITSLRIEEAFKELVALILEEGLSNRFFVFFTDGEECIFKTIELFFKGHWNYTIYLDWYHVVKKIYDKTSLFIQGTRVVDPQGEKEYYKRGPKKGQIKSQEMTSLSRLYARELVIQLWFGNVEEAIVYLKNIDMAVIKKSGVAEQQKLIKYLEGKGKYITCSGLRKKAGLRNSSNGSENLNQIDVSIRQKKQGMSWQEEGSSALSSHTCLRENGEQDDWFIRRTFHPRLKPVKKKQNSTKVEEATVADTDFAIETGTDAY